VNRLACEKAAIVSKENPRAIVIGSDQIAVFEDRVIGKPGDYPSAKKQLISLSGHCIEFLTAVSVQCLVTGFTELHIDSTEVKFRDLQEDEIERYLLAETPYYCAGAFKAESLGITLFERIKSDDPTALIGLPLIHTAAMLRRAGLLLP
jgi:septum formation protein